MRAFLPSYNLRQAQTLDELLKLLAAEPGVWKPLAGGTDVMVSFAAGKLTHRNFVDILPIKELCGIAEGKGELILGALASYADVLASASCAKHFPNLQHAARLTGALAIQNRGTLGGNIMNASPIADTPPALMAYGARVELASASGRRTVDYSAFHKGYKIVDAAQNEVLTKIILPLPAPNAFHFYRKVGTRKAQSISKICFAACASAHNGALTNVGIGMGGVGPTTVRLKALESLLTSKRFAQVKEADVKKALEADITTIDDIRSTAEYRKTVSLNVAMQFLSELRKHVELDR